MFGNKRICMVSDNRWRNKTVAESLNIDYLYVCKGYTGKLEFIGRFVSLPGSYFGFFSVCLL